MKILSVIMIIIMALSMVPPKAFASHEFKEVFSDPQVRPLVVNNIAFFAQTGRGQLVGELFRNTATHD